MATPNASALTVVLDSESLRRLRELRNRLVGESPDLAGLTMDALAGALLGDVLAEQEQRDESESKP